MLVWSKSDQRRLRKTLHKQTDKQTDTTKIMVTWPEPIMFNKKAVLSQETTARCGTLVQKACTYKFNSRATQWIEITLKLSANMESYRKTTLQVHRWRTDACRSMVSRDPGPKFTKFGKWVSIDQTPNAAKFPCAPTKSVEISLVEKFCSTEK